MSNFIADRAIALSQASSDADAIEQKHRQIAADFEQELAKSPPDLTGVQLALSDYLSAVKLVLDDYFDHEVWVRAEIRAINSKGGHYYFELAETDDEENITASCRATLWRFRAKTVLAKFTAATGQTLQAGTSVLLKCSASFHAQYGFSLNISDIDPHYTLGELAAAYQAMKNRLHESGLLNLNKQIPLPFDIRHVLVIAPEQAAGLGDFRAEADRLAATKACFFSYHHATFQGNGAADEIRTTFITSLDNFQKNHNTLPDLVAIIRGGGAVGDLAYLNNYELAAVIAESPVPVWTGIGHERDLVLLDEVAHTRFDTPSKLVLAIQSHLMQMISKATAAMDRLIKFSKNKLSKANQDNQQQLQRIRLNSTHGISLAKKDLLHQHKYLKNSTKHHCSQTTHRLNTLLTSTRAATQAITTQAKISNLRYFNQHKIVFDYLSKLKNNCRYLQSLILIQHPKRTLQKGYAIIHEQSQSACNIAHIAQLYPKQKIQITLQDGTATATIDAIDTRQMNSTTEIL